MEPWERCAPGWEPSVHYGGGAVNPGSTGGNLTVEDAMKYWHIVFFVALGLLIAATAFAEYEFI